MSSDPHHGQKWEQASPDSSVGLGPGVPPGGAHGSAEVPTAPHCHGCQVDTLAFCDFLTCATGEDVVAKRSETSTQSHTTGPEVRTSEWTGSGR